MSTILTIDSSKCTSCGECTRECHRHLPVHRRSEMSSDGVECVGCLHCYAICPQHAIQVNGMTSELQRKSNGDGTLDESQFLDFLAIRRSVRRFTDQAVPKSVVEKLIRAAGFIPSGGNSHSYQFTVITSGETRNRLEQELRKIYALRRRILKNSALKNLFALLSSRQTRAFLRDDTYLKRLSYLLEQYEQGEDPVFYHAPLIIIVHSDTLVPTPGEDSVLAAYNIVLMGETLGLGSCLVSLAQNAINTSRKCRNILNMGPADRVHAVVVLGYPAVQFHRAVPREPKTIEWIGTC